MLHTKAMKASDLLLKIAPKLHHRHHHAGKMKWTRNGETITDASYEVTERELKTHQRLQAQTDLQRLSN